MDILKIVLFIILVMELCDLFFGLWRRLFGFIFTVALIAIEILFILLLFI